MCKGQSGASGSNTVVQQSQPPQQVMQAYQQLLQRAQGNANIPYQQYGGGLLAGFNPTQTGAFGQTAQAAQAYQPYQTQATNYANMAANPVFGNVDKFSGANVGKYESPYQNDVIKATMAQINNNNAIQSNQLLGQGIASGNAFGGDRLGVAAAQLGNQQALASNQTLAGLNNQNYSQALGELNNQQNLQLQGMSGDAWRQANAASQMGSLGAQAQGLGLAGASANMQVGGLQQQLQQEQLNIPYQMWQQQQAYPFQSTQFLDPIAMGLGSGMGGSSSTTQPSPSMLSQIGGLGMTGLGIAGMTDAFGTGGWLTGLLGGGAAASGIGAGVGGTLADAAMIGFLKRGGRVGYDNGGAVPSGGTYQRYLGMSMEDLQRQAVMYPPSTPQGQAIQRALATKRMMPSMNAMTAPNSPSAPFADLGSGGLSAGSAGEGFAGGGLAGSAFFNSGGDDPAYGLPPPPIIGMLPDTSSTEDSPGESYGAGPDAGPYAVHAAPSRGKSHPRIASGLSAALASQPKQDIRGPSNALPPAPEAQPVDYSSSAAAGAPTQVADASPSAASGVEAGAGGPNSSMGGMLDSPWLGVTEAGLATMGGTSPFAAVNIGRGALAGIQGAQEQRKMGADIGYRRAQAEAEQATADMTKLQAKWMKEMPGLGGFGDIGGGGGGGYGGTAGGQGADEITAQGSPMTPLSAIAPNAARALQMSVMYGMRGNQGASAGWKAMAEMDPAYQHFQSMSKEGAVMGPDGQYYLPTDTLKVMQAKGLLGKTFDADKNSVAYGTDGQLHRISSVTQNKAGQTVITLNPNAFTEGEQGGDRGASQQQAPTAEVFGKQYAPLFAQSEKDNGLPANMLAAQGFVESNFNPRAISPAGAQGVMQFMPRTAADSNVRSFDPNSAIPGAGQLMGGFMQKYQGNPVEALAAYNWGPGHVDQWIQNGRNVAQLPEETRNYIMGVTNRMYGNAVPPGIGGDQGTQTADSGHGIVTKDPQAEKIAETEGGDIGKQKGQFNDESAQAYQGNVRLDQMMSESHNWDMNKWSDTWKGIQSYYAPLFPKNEDLQRSLSDWNAFNKGSGALVREATRATSSKAAFQEMELISKSLPNSAMPNRRSFVQVALQMKGINDYQMARSDAYNALPADADKGNFINAFGKQAGPAAFTFLEAYHNKLSDPQGEGAQIFDDMVKNMQGTDEGKKTLAHLAQQVRYIEQNNLFGAPGPQ